MKQFWGQWLLFCFIVDPPAQEATAGRPWAPPRRRKRCSRGRVRGENVQLATKTLPEIGKSTPFFLMNRKVLGQRARCKVDEMARASRGAVRSAEAFDNDPSARERGDALVELAFGHGGNENFSNSRFRSFKEVVDVPVAFFGSDLQVARQAGAQTVHRASRIEIGSSWENAPAELSDPDLFSLSHADDN